MDLTRFSNREKPCQWADKTGVQFSPADSEQLAAFLQASLKARKPVALRYEDAGLMMAPRWIDCSEMKRVLKFAKDDLIITVETGLTMGELREVTEVENLVFPLSYPDDVLLLDVLAEDRPSPETGFRGYPRDYVLKTETVTPDGVVAIAGADVVKNVTGYDLNKIYVGAHHALGVISAVTLKLFPKPQKTRRWVLDVFSHKDAENILKKLTASTLPLSACELIHPAGQNAWQVYIELSGDTLFLDEAVSVLRKDLFPNEIRVWREVSARDWDEKICRRPAGSVVMEAALPLGAWYPMLENLIELTPHLTMQVRPAAGLFYFILQPEMENYAFWLSLLKPHAENLGGILQCVHAPDDLWETLGAAYNLPPDSRGLHLMKKLKYGYDPRHVLFTPRMPLTPENT